MLWRVGISSCLLGEPVRYDGGHKRHEGVIDILGPHVEWISVCPEVELEMGVPRERVNLVGKPDSPFLIGVESGKDWSVSARIFFHKRVKGLVTANLDGYVLKKRSPSCGLQVPVYEDRTGTRSIDTGKGLFAEALTQMLPGLPVVEEEDLQTKGQVQLFLERMAAYGPLKLAGKI